MFLYLISSWYTCFSYFVFLVTEEKFVKSWNVCTKRLTGKEGGVYSNSRKTKKEVLIFEQNQN